MLAYWTDYLSRFENAGLSMCKVVGRDIVGFFRRVPIAIIHGRDD